MYVVYQTRYLRRSFRELRRILWDFESEWCSSWSFTCIFFV